MKIHFKKKNGVLVPSLPQDDEILQKWKDGDILETETKKIRNPKFHRKFMALLNVVFENQSSYDSFDALRYEITMRSGFFIKHIHVTNKVSFYPKSISFAKMDEIEFSNLYDRAIDVILKYFMPKTSKEEIEKMVLIVMNFS